MRSIARVTSTLTLPPIEGKVSMLPFDLSTLEGLSEEYALIASQMLEGIAATGTPYGMTLEPSE